jgi:hypothetical protein
MPLRRRRNIIVAAVIGGVILGALVAFVVWRSTAATDDPAVAGASPGVTSTAAPSVSPEVSGAPVSAPPAMAPDVFAAYVSKNVRDIDKDLNDLDAALEASNVLRIASNDEEIEYGLRQLQAAGPPAHAATDWQISVQVIELRVAALRKDITAKDYRAATADVAAIRTELTNTLAIAVKG